jgi:hypothetical protein
MKRESHAFLFHFLYQQTDRPDHYYGIGCFDGNNHIVEMFRNTDTQKFHARFHHTFRGVTIMRHDAV